MKFESDDGATQNDQVANEARKKLTSSVETATSPTFNQMALVSTSTPSSINEQDEVTINQSNQQAPSQQQQSQLNSQPTLKSENIVIHQIEKSNPSSDENNASGKLTIFVNKQDFSCQVTREELINDMNTKQKTTESAENLVSPNSKSGHIIDDNLAKVSAIEELDRCIAEFDNNEPTNYASNEQKLSNLNKIESPPAFNNKSFTTVSEMSAKPSAHDNSDLSVFKEGNIRILARNNNSNKINNNNTSISFNVDENSSLMITSPDLNNNSNLENANAKISEMLVKPTQSNDRNFIPPVPPPLPTGLKTIDENSSDFKNFLMKNVKK